MNSVVRPIFNEIFVKKEVCGSREQCTRPTEQYILSLERLKRMHQKRKRKRKTQTQQMKRNPNAQ